VLLERCPTLSGEGEEKSRALGQLAPVPCPN
jgi:hypothetical protein